MVKHFESHITIDLSVDHGFNEPHVVLEDEAATEGFSYSSITGDPVFGKKPYSYLTKHSADKYHLEKKNRVMVSHLRNLGFRVVRMKIEEIVLDERYQVEV